ncbi:hypothetical protein JCM19992_05430 [Thermostilla marina]
MSVDPNTPENLNEEIEAGDALEAADEARETEVAAPTEQETSEAVEDAEEEATASAPEADAEEAETAEDETEESIEDQMDWYILKVQNNREDTIREAILRRIKVAGLEKYFGEIIVPTERVTEFKRGKRRVVKRKLYPGYIVIQMAINDDTWFLVRETPGVGDFTGAIGRPTPMLPHEVERIKSLMAEETGEDQPKLKIGFSVGDRVKVNEGNFANFEGEVSAIDEANGHVTVMINIFGRSTPVELGYWQIEPVE